MPKLSPGTDSRESDGEPNHHGYRRRRGLHGEFSSSLHRIPRPSTPTPDFATA